MMLWWWVRLLLVIVKNTCMEKTVIFDARGLKLPLMIPSMGGVKKNGKHLK
jgi:hypothetical protein